MNLAEVLARLEPRERRLLGILGILLAGMIFLALPVGIAAAVHSKSSENDALREAMTSIEESREAIERAKASRAAVTARYASAAPPLAAFLARIAGEVQLEIPESQDRQAVPHGKRYTERSTKIVLRKVGMLKLLQFMEKIETSGHPVAIGSLNIRKRGAEPDSYDVDMVVSAYDRKAPEPKKSVEPAASADEDAEAAE